MKKYLFFTVLLALIVMQGSLLAQEDKSKRASPPATAMNDIDGLQIKIDYSQPSVKDRVIWGELVPYDKIWRTGANEATTIEFSRDVKVNGENVAAGRYSLFTIPGEKGWTVILNSEADQWGSYKYNEEKDVMRFSVKPEATEEKVEQLTFEVDDEGTVSMMWDELMFSFDVD